jgi:bisphosphoglycerate-independent phosphoglycerate mutase (AlkP superfamily)
MSRASRQQHARIIDLAPTIVNYLGVAVPESMEGVSLL